MTSSLVLLTVACFLVKTDSAENIYSDNGWRPMSNEKVFELQRNFIKAPLDVIENVPENPMDNVFQRGNVIKMVEPNHLKQSIKEYEAIFPLQNERKARAFEEPTESEFEDELQERYIDLNEQNDLRSNNIRKSKKITESDIKLFLDNKIKDDKSNSNSKDIQVQNKYNIFETNKYEVKENVEEDFLDNLHDLKPRYIGYNYQVPKKTKPKNLTTNLFDILANYNIKTSDKLPNYALSLRQNSRNSNNNEFVYMHVPVKIPLRYNSPNHFPIDPLLAVFLSNYGFYLSGLYGYQRSFNNLYGYLASNNIHNNKPFGLYKVFSDTDSSH